MAKVNRQTKETRGMLERAISNAVVMVRKDRNTKSIFFDDKGLRLTVTEDYAVIETLAHRHVFDKVTSSGYSRPYMYVSQFVDIACENDCIVKDEKGNVTRSYARLFQVLKEKEDDLQYKICWYVDIWLFNIFAPLYTIDESEISSFVVYEEYLHNIARQSVILGEKKEDMSKLQYVDQIAKQERSFFDGFQDAVMFKAKTDEERTEEAISTLQDDFAEKVINNESQQANG